MNRLEELLDKNAELLDTECQKVTKLYEQMYNIKDKRMRNQLRKAKLKPLIMELNNLEVDKKNLGLMLNHQAEAERRKNSKEDKSKMMYR